MDPIGVLIIIVLCALLIWLHGYIEGVDKASKSAIKEANKLLDTMKRRHPSSRKTL